MSTADHILDQIDTCLGDYSVSDDAMRCGPDVPVPPPAVRPRVNGRNILVQRLIDRHGLGPEQARAAVLAAERGEPGEHAELAGLEARRAADEVMRSIRTAFQPMLERVADQFKQMAEVFAQLRIEPSASGKPDRRRDRPAWQSPYGPARRR